MLAQVDREVQARMLRRVEAEAKFWEVASAKDKQTERLEILVVRHGVMRMAIATDSFRFRPTRSFAWPFDRLAWNMAKRIQPRA